MNEDCVFHNSKFLFMATIYYQQRVLSNFNFIESVNANSYVLYDQQYILIEQENNLICNLLLVRIDETNARIVQVTSDQQMREINRLVNRATIVHVILLYEPITVGAGSGAPSVVFHKIIEPVIQRTPDVIYTTEPCIQEVIPPSSFVNPNIVNTVSQVEVELFTTEQIALNLISFYNGRTLTDIQQTRPNRITLTQGTNGVCFVFYKQKITVEELGDLLVGFPDYAIFIGQYASCGRGFVIKNGKINPTPVIGGNVKDAKFNELLGSLSKANEQVLKVIKQLTVKK